MKDHFIILQLTLTTIEGLTLQIFSMVHHHWPAKEVTNTVNQQHLRTTTF